MHRPDQGWWHELVRLDVAVYAAIAATPTLAVDRGCWRLSRVADPSKLWLSGAAVLAGAGRIDRDTVFPSPVT